MRKVKLLLTALLCVCLCLTAAACKGPADDPGTDAPPPPDYKKSLKILAIGNSFADDALWYGAQTAKNLGAEDVTVGILYIGGCSIQQHYQNSVTGDKAYTYRKTKDGQWNNQQNRSLLYGLTDEDWDIISIQQASPVSGIAKFYNSSLDKLLDFVDANKTNRQAKTVFHMTWAYQSDSNHSAFPNYDSDQQIMYAGITGATQSEIVEKRGSRFDVIVPSGTAIQNARTCYRGDKFTRDGYHLSELGRAVAAATFVGAVTGWPLDGLTYMPATCNPVELPLVVESAKNALAKPYEVTASKLTAWPELPQYDYTGLSLIDWKPVVSAYYNSFDAANRTNLITAAGNSKYFVASAVRFTPETLPVGSVIEVAGGWKYRPDGWGPEDAPLASRPEQIYGPHRLVVDAAFWDGVSARALILSEDATNSDLTMRAEEAVSKLTVRVPQAAAPAPADPVDDSVLFAEKGLDPADYTLLDWVPTNGYWNSGMRTTMLAADSTSKSYLATQRFTKKTLPTGSVLVLDDGYKFISEGWVDDLLNLGTKDAENNSGLKRPAYVTAAGLYLTDEAWWTAPLATDPSQSRTFTYRAFNLAKKAGGAVNTDPLGHAAHLRIYIPKAQA